MNIFDSLGDEPKTEKKRRGRKPKKQSEKSLLNTYFADFPKDDPTSARFFGCETGSTQKIQANHADIC